MNKKSESGLHPPDMLLLWVAMILWLLIFLIGTLINSKPYRDSFASFEGGVLEIIKNGLIVIFTYALTNIIFLCILSGMLGVLGNKAVLVPDALENLEPKDITSPRNSALIRCFIVYLTLISGVLILGNEPAITSQVQYVRLAGLISIIGFVVNYRPSSFAQLLHSAGNLMMQPSNKSNVQGEIKTHTLHPQ